MDIVEYDLVSEEEFNQDRTCRRCGQENDEETTWDDKYLYRHSSCCNAPAVRMER